MWWLKFWHCCWCSTLIITLLEAALTEQLDKSMLCILVYPNFQQSLLLHSLGYLAVCTHNQVSVKIFKTAHVTVARASYVNGYKGETLVSTSGDSDHSKSSHFWSDAETKPYVKPNERALHSLRFKWMDTVQRWSFQETDTKNGQGGLHENTGADS